MYRRTFLRSLLFASGATLTGGTAFPLQSKKLEVTYERVIMPDIEQNIRIVSLSDLHAPSIYVSRLDLINTINQLKPDVLVLAGDIIGKRKTEHWVMTFKKLKPKLAKVAVLGNWEYGLKLDLAKLRGHYQEAGINLLVNKSLEIQGLKIIGLDDFIYGSPDYNLLNDLKRDLKPKIAVSHCPEAFDCLPSKQLTPLIIISGHTHGGQIAPFGKALIIPPGSGNYVHGWYHKKNKSMYVMRGVGPCIVPLRIGTI